MSNFLKFLGLTRRAGKVIAGGNLVEAAFGKKRLSLLILAADASAGTKRKFLALAENHGLDVLEIATTEELGQAIGKGQISVIAITDGGMSRKLKELCIAM